MSNIQAQITEIFNSFQGEGPYIGERQSFIRFGGCNLSCQYCDTPARDISNSKTMSAEEILSRLNELEKPRNINHSICLTGGEPLLHAAFLQEFLPEMKKNFKLPVYLETNGTLPDHLADVIELVDIIAMDIKLASATGMSGYLREHKKFLETAYLKQVFVKIIFTKETLVKELDEACQMIGAVDANILLVLQPVAPHGPIKHRPAAEQIFAFFNTAKRRLNKVRAIPQAHKIMGIN